jgi:hypothetical protein
MTMTRLRRTIRTPRSSARAFLGLLVASGLVLAACSGATPSASRHTTHKKTAKTTTTTTLAASTTTSTTSTAPSGPLASPCNGSVLKGAQVSFGAAAGGAATTVVALTNTSKSPCSLDGYPRLQLISEKGADLPTTVEHGGTGIPTSLGAQGVNLAARGGQASFMLYWVPTPSSSQPTCPQATKMTVSVPGSSKSFTMTAEINACGGIVQASPFQAGLVKLP